MYNQTNMTLTSFLLRNNRGFSFMIDHFILKGAESPKILLLKWLPGFWVKFFNVKDLLRQS